MFALNDNDPYSIRIAHCQKNTLSKKERVAVGARLGRKSIWNIVHGFARTCQRRWLARLTGNPLEGARGDETQNQEGLVPKVGRVSPSVSIFVGPLKRDVEHGSFLGFLPPDACAYGTVTDFVDGL